ncbi:MAG: helix-turn-helix transcriptional regulator [Saprospiraceae bacterium]|nr:helix-turn-helix transcriptional regulator [Saprospiraceae bacterium]MBK8670263.1 helix-turn-helix transcriptional regulator [Saprospiraceae bacterium]MBL0101292.1 helix-turn-helix transcriptional regulator [Saprospiraceae bacterium]
MEISNKTEYFFGKNVRFLRKAKKMTLLSLSDALKISKSAISDYEIGHTLPSLDVVQKISSFFDVPMDDLYNSEISELFENNNDVLTRKKDDAVERIKNVELENEKYVFNLKLLAQKLESTQLQIQMLKQLLESREAENKTLKINIKLLEEQQKNFS